MSFLWPEMLWLLTTVPALIAAYLFLLGRKKKTALRYANLNLVKEATEQTVERAVRRLQKEP